MNDFDILGYASSGMQAQRAALELYAHNIALAQTASQSHPVHTLVPEFEAAKAEFEGVDSPFGAGPASEGSELDTGLPVSAADDSGLAFDDGDEPSVFAEPKRLPGSVQFAGAKTSPKKTYAVDSVAEMINVLNAQRAYEANASVFHNGAQLIERTLQLEGGQ
jgi:flagellar basal body rod protein FlgC